MKVSGTFIPSVKHVRSHDVADHNIFQIGKEVNQRSLIAEYSHGDRPCYIGYSFYADCAMCEQHKAYTVMSYHTLIFQQCENCGRTYFNDYYYSDTTSKLQSAIVQAYGLTEQWNASAKERKADRRAARQG